MEADVPEDEKIGAEQLIEMYYGPLTEFSHPNWGALNLDTKFEFPPKVASSAAFEAFKMHSVVSSTAYILEAGGKSIDSLLQTLEDAPMDLPNGGPVWEK